MLSNYALGLLNLALFLWNLSAATIVLCLKSSELLESPTDEKQATEAARRSESISLTLGGFTLAALAVVIAFRESLAGLEFSIFFLSFSFTMFIISVVFFANRTRIIWKELGGIAQDYGLLLLVAGLIALLDAVNLLTSLTAAPPVILGIFVMGWQVVDIVMIHTKNMKR